ncbi:MAG: hypothetical protein LBE82_05490 [Chitinophagaceae bacterium]|nr:hypothetical protein [Chitinophagaceae bacterium]
MQHSMQFEKGTFGYDVNFLKSKDSLLAILKSNDSAAMLIISPKYQGKVFTSSANGYEGKSFGWVNYTAFDKNDAHMNGYGGEDRVWLGPEGGKFSLFFKQGTKMVFDNWHTPPPFDSEAWTLVSSNGNKVSLKKEMNLENYAGTNLMLTVERDIELFNRKNIEQALGITLDSSIKSVGFSTVNTLTNTGTNSWTETSGAPCIWNLDMFSPSPKTIVIIPYIENATGKIATTDYFGEIPKDRISFKNGTIFFKADGKSRGKLGVPPARVKNVAGSYSPENNLLTIVQFDIDNKASYLNQEWRTDKVPYSGDAMNAYNDGPLADGSQMGPFYELESVSPPAFLKQGEKIIHRHSVFHFTGNKNVLDEIAQKVLGTAPPNLPAGEAF